MSYQNLTVERRDGVAIVTVCTDTPSSIRAGRVKHGLRATMLADPELGALARQELPELEAALGELEKNIRVLLLPQDPNDEKNTLLEIRAGTGGEEAALFVVFTP